MVRRLSKDRIIQAARSTRITVPADGTHVPVYVTGYCPTHRTHEIHSQHRDRPAATSFAGEALDAGWSNVRTDLDHGLVSKLSYCASRGGR